MNLIFTSYASAPEYAEPKVWLKRIEGYTGILEALSKMHNVTGIERINYKGELELNGVRYYFIRLKKKIVRFPWRLHRLIKKLSPDVIFINGFIFPLQIIQLRLMLGREVKIIILHRSEKPFNGIKKLLQRLAWKCIDAIFFASHEFGEQWVKNGNIPNTKKVHEIIQASSVFHPFDKELSRNKLSVTGSPVFLWVGGLSSNKDPVTVIKAFIQFHDHYPNAMLYMIYQSNELLPTLLHLLSDSKTDAIHLVGKVEHEALQDWYSSADFILSSSHYEGNGVAVCEGMSCGCIPVLTDIISFRKMTGGKCGLLFEHGNEKDLLATLLSTMQLDMDRERIKVLDHFQKELSFEAIARKINHVIGYP